jgi:outer membrane protein TolC
MKTHKALPFFAIGILLSNGARAESANSFLNAVATMVQNSPKHKAILEQHASKIAESNPLLYAHYPHLSASAIHQTSKAFDTKFSTAQSTTLATTVSIPVWRFGADTISTKQGQTAQDLAHAEMVAEVAALESEMATLAIEFLKAQKQFILEERITKARAETLAKAEVLFKKGLLPQEELEKMRLDVGLAKVALSENKTRMEELKRKVTLFHGSEIANLDWPWETEFFMPILKRNEPTLAAGALDKALRIGVLRTQQNAWELQKAKATALPSVEASGQIAKTFRHNSNSQTEPSTWNAGISATIPLFERMQNYGRIESAARSHRAAQFQAQSKEIEVKNETTALLSTMKDKVASAQERISFLAQAQKNLEKSRERFLTGKISSNDLSMDETRLFQMEQNLLDNIAALQQTGVQLCSTLVVTLAECTGEWNSLLQK